MIARTVPPLVFIASPLVPRCGERSGPPGNRTRTIGLKVALDTSTHSLQCADPQLCSRSRPRRPLNLPIRALRRSTECASRTRALLADQGAQNGITYACALATGTGHSVLVAVQADGKALAKSFS